MITMWEKNLALWIFNVAKLSFGDVVSEALRLAKAYEVLCGVAGVHVAKDDFLRRSEDIGMRESPLSRVGCL